MLIKTYNCVPTYNWSSLVTATVYPCLRVFAPPMFRGDTSHTLHGVIDSSQCHSTLWLHPLSIACTSTKQRPAHIENYVLSITKFVSKMVCLFFDSDWRYSNWKPVCRLLTPQSCITLLWCQTAVTPRDCNDIILIRFTNCSCEKMMKVMYVILLFNSHE